MAIKRSRSLFVNWRAVDGSAHGKRKLVLRKNDKELYTCPINLCLHSDYKSSRGLRKHIDGKHSWYYYFDEQPEVKREEIEMNQPAKKKICTSKKPSFTLEEGIGREFLRWLCTSCGGGKSPKEAQQIGKRAMKFFMEALGNNESENDLTYEFVDCCLSSASILIAFLQTLEEDWKISSSASLNYVKAIGDMVDFRKASGLSDTALRCFTVIEVYLRRAKENLRKKKNLECNRNLDLETLIAKDSWASIEEMERVIPFHVKLFRTYVDKAKSKKADVSKRDLVFCTRFITTLLFLRVKSSRPMSYQYLTIAMVQKAQHNDGFIDQTEFKTAPKYIFDTLIITEDVMFVLNLYIDFIRPLLNPTCNYLLLSTNGTQFQSLTTAMTMLVYQAIGKYINPTRYRQIIETESSERLTLQEQQIISEDQKHSSKVAQIFYKKKTSRKVAIEGKKCMEKMTKQARSGDQNDIREAFKDIEALDRQFEKSVLDKSKSLFERGESSRPGSSGMFEQGESSGLGSSSMFGNNNHDEVEERSSSVNPYLPYYDDNDSTTDLSITKVTAVSNENNSTALSCYKEVPNDDVVVKKEVVNLVTKQHGRNSKFSSEEDKFLKDGIIKYGKKAWALILKDSECKFHPSRTRDALRMRADTMAFKKYFVKDH